MRGGKKGSKVKDAGYIDSTLSSLFPHALTFLSLVAGIGHGWDKMAAGGSSPGPGSGLCVVINGNLKQRELTISFFISSRRCSVAREASSGHLHSRLEGEHTREARPQKGSFLGGW